MLPPIFIVGYAKSGTTLLQSLLDDHPELFVLPLEIRFFKFPNLPSIPPGNMPPRPLPEWKIPIPRKDVSADELKHEILNHAEFVNFLNGKNLKRNISFSEVDVDIEKFINIIKERNFNSLKELYIGFWEAFYAAWKGNGNVHRYRLVEKTPHQEEYVQELKTWFPEAKFIHVLRNPYANIYSVLVKTSITRGATRYIYREMAKSFYFLERNKRYIEDYFVVKYEDIVLSTEATMREIANFLAIDFHQNLLQPTICGIPWQGNSRTTKGKFNGINKKPLDAYRNKIPTLDVALINRYFSHFLEKYGYEIIPTSGIKEWLPIRWETPVSYIKNRYLLHDNVL